MIISPDKNDFSTILNLLGRLILGLGVFLLFPIVVAFLNKETSPLLDFIISFLICVSLGQFITIIFPAKKELTWMHSFFAVSFGWLVYSLLGAIPLYLAKEHFSCFLDAWFEVTSGFATTGFSLCRDLDHLSLSHNIWRHFTMLIGGQGIIIAGLSILSRAQPAAVGFYVGEARSEKILPSVVATSRFIWEISVLYLFLGVASMSAILWFKGVDIYRAVYHAFCIFCAAFDTGGFGTQAQNFVYYHSLALEIAAVFCMIMGGISFNLHYWAIAKSRREMFKDIETRTFLFTFFGLLVFVYIGLKNMGIFYMFRKGFFHLISAHSGCGFSNAYVPELMSYPPIVLIAIIAAMGLGMGACSTTGGIKLMRVGVIFKTIAMEIKKLMLPLQAHHKERIHHLQTYVLDDARAKEAFMIFTLFLILYAAGGIAGIMYGYPPMASFFESVSAAGNVGLSMGITTPSMPSGLKIIYALQMWLGRLEILSVLVPIGFLVSLLKK